MRTKPSQTKLDSEVVFDRSIGPKPDLDTLQAVLQSLAPRWSTGLRVWKNARDQRPIDIRRRGALASAVLSAAFERGATYGELTLRYGRPPMERAFGSVELRGTGSELIVIVGIDEMVLSPVGARKNLGNHITFQVRKPSVETRPSSIWLRDAFQKLASEMSPAWGEASQSDEYSAKVMSYSPRVEAIGRDFGRFLPGLFWLNFFGSRYRDMIGVTRLTTAPADRVQALDDGVFMQLDADPTMWNSEDYVLRERRVRDHLGTEFFFQRHDEGRPTLAPDWGR